MDTNKNSSKWSKKTKRIIAGIVLLIIACTGIGIYAASGSSAPDPKKMNNTDAVKYAASKNFASLSRDEKVKYAKEMREKMQSSGSNPWRMMRNSNLSDTEKKQLRENMRSLMPVMMRERAKKLMAMSKEERDKEYDRIADAIKKRIAANGGRRWGNNNTNSNNGNQNHQRNENRRTEFMKRHLEGTDSDTRAIMAEMHKEIRKRLSQK